MCFGSKKKLQEKYHPEPPVAYRIGRDGDDPSKFTYRRYSSIKRHNDIAPTPVPRPNGKHRFPKVHKNVEGFYSVPKGGIFEYPSMPWKYAEQNAAGKVKNIQKDGSWVQNDWISPGYTRTITDQGKQIQGVSFHPTGHPGRHIRAAEIYKSGSVYEYQESGMGARQKVQHKVPRKVRK